MILLLCARPGAAQTTSQRVADVASYATWGASEVIDTARSFQAEHKGKAFALQGVRIGLSALVVLGSKALIHERRPCAPDCGRDKPDTSFLSGHALFTASAIGPNKTLQFSLTVPTASLRVGANKHHVWDVAAGAVAGALIGRLR